METALPEEIRRTSPDRVIYDPTGGIPRAWDDPDFFWLNEQILVVRTCDGHLLATWTTERLDPHLLRIACARSEDEGRSWSEPQIIDGDGIGDGGPAAWQVPVVGPHGRIYLMYSHSSRPGSGAFGGGLRCRTSDDGGRTWSHPADLSFPRSPIDSPDADKPSIWIAISVPITTKSGCPLLGFTRWANNPDIPHGAGGIKERYSHIEFVRFDNSTARPDAEDVQLVPLNVDAPITVPHEDDPSASFAQEPYTVVLPDDRLFTVMRSNRGQTWYALSSDEGETWSTPQPMLCEDGGKPMLHPTSPCPVYDVGKAEYLFLFHDNDGSVFGAESRWDVRNRRPAFVSLGRYRPGAEQPIWWGAPHLLVDNDAVPWGPEGQGRLEAAAYPSLTKSTEGHILWYPDRKGFLVGKDLTEGYLSALDQPKEPANKATGGDA